VLSETYARVLRNIAAVMYIRLRCSHECDKDAAALEVMRRRREIAGSRGFRRFRFFNSALARVCSIRGMRLKH